MSEKGEFDYPIITNATNLKMLPEIVLILLNARA
jgi:hypothetical protein